MTYNGFGNGSDGAVTLSGTDAPVDSSCSGTSGTTSLSATNVSFADEKLVLIHQSRGTGAGNWEINIIDSYVAGTITTLFDLVNTYTDSGASQAQVIQLKEYSSVTVSGTLTAKAWDGNVGGIIAFLCNGATNISGSLNVKGKGFIGGASPNVGSGGASGRQGYQGESYNGAGSQGSSSANGSGGGGGLNGGGDNGGGGGGAGHAAVGQAGTNGTGGAADGQGGSAGAASTDTSSLSTAVFGSGGGSGCSDDGARGGAGGNGGGGIFIWTNSLIVTGSINANADDAGSVTQVSGGSGGGGGGGSGGFVLIYTVEATIGTDLITALGGIGTDGNPAFGDTGGNGGDGATGRIAVHACSITGSSSPANNGTTGGHDFCQSFISIY